MTIIIKSKPQDGIDAQRAATKSWRANSPKHSFPLAYYHSGFLAGVAWAQEQEEKRKGQA